VTGAPSVAWRMEIPWATMEIAVLCQRSNLGAQLVILLVKPTTNF